MTVDIVSVVMQYHHSKIQHFILQFFMCPFTGQIWCDSIHSPVVGGQSVVCRKKNWEI